MFFRTHLFNFPNTNRLKERLFRQRWTNIQPV